MWDRDIIAIQVTRNATGTDNDKPAVLYNAMQHAREWLAGETCKRTLEFFTSLYGKDRQVTRLVNDRQLWFVCVNNPDGYEFTFTEGNRLWRKNLRDRTAQPDPERRRRRPEPQLPRELGPRQRGLLARPRVGDVPRRRPASEPETQAMLELWNRVDFEFQKNDHTAAELILYPQGWQQYTPAADDPIFTALAGDDEDPAIPGFDPDLGAELYITNGDTLDTAYNQKGILAYTPEGSCRSPIGLRLRVRGRGGSHRDRVPDHRNFSIDLAESADDPANPDSHLGNTVEDFYVDSFPYSYGDPQTGAGAGEVDAGSRVKYRINSGAVQTTATTEWNDGQRYYQEEGEYYHRLRGAVRARRRRPGEVWFEDADGAKRSDVVHLQAVDESNNEVLLLAAEDYTGPTPADADGGPSTSTSTPARSRQRLSAGPLRRRRRRAARRRTRSACSRTTTRSSGTRATTT